MGGSVCPPAKFLWDMIFSVEWARKNGDQNAEEQENSKIRLERADETVSDKQLETTERRGFIYSLVVDFYYLGVKLHGHIELT